VIEKPCCGDQSKGNDCCKEIKEVNKLTSDIYSVNAAIKLPNILLFAIAILDHFDFSHAVLSKEHSFSSYSPPLIIPDKSVLYQVFRI
jgi:hypothetical protein